MGKSPERLAWRGPLYMPLSARAHSVQSTSSVECCQNASLAACRHGSHRWREHHSPYWKQYDAAHASSFAIRDNALSATRVRSASLGAGVEEHSHSGPPEPLLGRGSAKASPSAAAGRAGAPDEEQTLPISLPPPLWPSQAATGQQSASNTGAQE